MACTSVKDTSQCSLTSVAVGRDILVWRYVNQLSGPESHTSVARRPINNAIIKFDFSAVDYCSTQSCLWTEFVDFLAVNKLAFILNGLTNI